MHNTRSLLHVLKGSLPRSLTLKIPIQEFFHSVKTSNQLTYFFFFFFNHLSLSNVNNFLLIFLRFSVLLTMMTPSQTPPSPCSYFCIYLTNEIPTLVKLNSWPLFHTCTRTVDWLETMHDHQILKWDLRNMVHFLNQWNLQFSETALWPFLFSSQTDYLTVHLT